MQIASSKGLTKLVKRLLETEMSPDSTGQSLTSPLAYACQGCHKDVVALLLDHGADINFCTLALSSNARQDRGFSRWQRP